MPRTDECGDGTASVTQIRDALERVTPRITNPNNKRARAVVRAGEQLAEMATAPGAKDELAEALTGGTKALRALVAEFLEAVGDRWSADIALRALSKSGSGQAASILAEIGDQRAVGPILEWLERGQGDETHLLVYALGSLGDKSAVPVVLGFLRDRDRDRRRAAVLALGELGDKAVVPQIVSSLEDSEVGSDDFFREAGAAALGRIGGREAKSMLVELLHDSRESVRNAALRGLKVARWAPLSVAEFSQLRKVIAEQNRHAGAEIRLHEFGLRSLVFEARQRLLQKLGAAPARGRVSVSIFLHRMGLYDFVVGQRGPTIYRRFQARRKFNRSHGEEREWAACELAALGDRTVLQTLLEAWGRIPKNEENSHRLRNVAEALGKIGDPIASGPLINTLGLNDARIESAAGTIASVLGRLRDVRAVPVLVDVVRSGLVQNEAARALGEIGDSSAVGPLLEILVEGPQNSKWVAAWALANLGDRESFDRVLELYQSTGAGIQALGAFRDPRAIVAILESARRNLRGGRFISASLEVDALGAIGGVGAVQPLLELARDERVAQESVSHLEEVLEAHARQVAPQTLREIAALKDLGQKETIEPDWDGYSPWSRTVPVDTSRIRQLAKSALRSMGS